MSKEKRKAPSRIRYEETNPTVSCRVSKEIYDKLQSLKQKEKKSFADILKVGLGILRSDSEKEVKAYQRGYDKGYRKAEEEFKVTYPCSVCGKIIALTSENEKRAASEYMTAHGWAHDECDEKRHSDHV